MIVMLLCVSLETSEDGSTELLIFIHDWCLGTYFASLLSLSSSLFNKDV